MRERDRKSRPFLTASSSKSTSNTSTLHQQSSSCKLSGYFTLFFLILCPSLLPFSPFLQKMVIQSTRSSSSSNNLSTTTSRNAPPRTSPRRSRKPIRTSPALDLSSLKLDYDPSKEVPKSSRPMGLQDAPTYWPSDKEWADPLGYIQKIAPEGRKYGIIKVT